MRVRLMPGFVSGLISAMLSLTGLIGAAGVCLADDGADSTKLAGIWDLDGGGGKNTWKLEGTQVGVHFAYTRGGQKVADFECNTTGKECSVRMDGKSAKVSVYFNGPRLVMLETRGDTIVKWRFGAVSEGQELEVETIPITPGGKTETLRFKRAEEQAASR